MMARVAGVTVSRRGGVTVSGRAGVTTTMSRRAGVTVTVSRRAGVTVIVSRRVGFAGHNGAGSGGDADESKSNDATESSDLGKRGKFTNVKGYSKNCTLIIMSCVRS